MTFQYAVQGAVQVTFQLAKTVDDIQGGRTGGINEQTAMGDLFLIVSSMEM